MSAPLSAERTYQLIQQCAAGMPANDDDLVDIGCAMTELRYARTFILELQAGLDAAQARVAMADEAIEALYKGFEEREMFVPDAAVVEEAEAAYWTYADEYMSDEKSGAATVSP